MVQARYTFPRGFLWGTATSSHQVEGNNTNNNWWAWEQEPGRILHGHTSRLACDWWGGRWREDLDRAAETHQNAHRLSIEWSRIQPTPDRWDEDALDRYREILRGVQQRNMTPMVTLHHFTDPLWLAEMGGWENPAAPDYFSHYVTKAVEALQGYANLWITINEPGVLLSEGYLRANFPPAKKDINAAFRVAMNLLRAHVSAYHAIHQVQPTARAGLSHHVRLFHPKKRWFPLDRLAARMFAAGLNETFPHALASGDLRLVHKRARFAEAKGTQDFFGVNYYTTAEIAFNLFKPGDLFGEHSFPPGAELSDTGFLANVPEGMFETLRWARRFGLPIIVTENGVEDAGDALRRRYLLQHLHQLWRAVNFNYPIKGYFHWTLVDNFEWERGWTQRFGLWSLDVDSQARTRRPSADLYASICRENAIDSEAAARYAPEIMDSMFPEE
ncbi:MAG: family 1 glycosylhydrolase [Anaerolineales bacterium]|nr:family 1 glycosylhydrolase [Anaerolineales bacterium]